MHHADHVHGYRRVHRVVTTRANGTPESQAGTEEMREAMLEARALFDDLMNDGNRNGSGHGSGGRHSFGASNKHALRGVELHVRRDTADRRLEHRARGK